MKNFVRAAVLTSVLAFGSPEDSENSTSQASTDPEDSKKVQVLTDEQIDTELAGIRQKALMVKKCIRKENFTVWGTYHFPVPDRHNPYQPEKFGYGMIHFPGSPEEYLSLARNEKGDSTQVEFDKNGNLTNGYKSKKEFFGDIPTRSEITDRMVTYEEWSDPARVSKFIDETRQTLEMFLHECASRDRK